MKAPQLQRCGLKLLIMLASGQLGKWLNSTHAFGCITNKGTHVDKI